MEVPVEPVRCDIEGVITISGCLVFACPDNAKAVHTHQTAHATVSNQQAYFLQFQSHSRPAITAQTEMILLADMGQQNHVVSLTFADRTVTPGPQATRCDPQQSAQAVNWDTPGMFFDKGKSHLL
jgi:hypothetical protein